VKKISIKTGLILASLVLVFSSCIHNDFEEPPVTIIPVGTILTVQDLYNMYVTEGSVKFTGDGSVYATVTMDDKSGNLYKSAYVQGGTTAINLHLLSSGGLYEGDSVRIYLKGLILGEYAGMMQLDSVDVDDNIVKVSTLNHKTPEVVTLGMINTNQYLGKLVKIENVQFVNEDLGLTYADDSLLVTENRTIEDEFGNTILVRTSGYASFAGDPIPEGRGSVIAIAGKYYDDHQLIIRNAGEVVFNERRFGDVDTLLFMNFDGIENGTSVSLSDWANIADIGSISWLGSVGSENSSVTITGDGNANTNWLVLPQIMLNSTGGMQFTTRAGNLTGANLSVYVSTDYTGDGDPQSANWFEFSDVIIGTAPASGYGEWTESGIVNLSDYTGNLYIAFKYNADDGQSGQFYLDDILIYSE
jgi:hypothetical protein